VPPIVRAANKCCETVTWTGSKTKHVGRLVLAAGFHAVDLRDASGRTATSRTGSRLRSALVACEVALALGVLISAGLLVQTARNIAQVNVGFDPSQLMTFLVSLDERQYSSQTAVHDFYQRLTADLGRRPGVVAAAAGSLVPFSNAGSYTEFFIEGRSEPAPGEVPIAALNHITAAYPETRRLRHVGGRLLNASDSTDRPKVAMINETLAKRYFDDRAPIGQRLRLGRTSQDLWSIVGIVGDVTNHETVDASEPQIYVPFAQQPVPEMIVVVRAKGKP
jgi:putative ABC transport system permease protein